MGFFKPKVASGIGPPDPKVERYTLQFPAEAQHLKTEDELLDNLRSLLGKVSTGAENDLERATAIARQIVAFYGMGESVGLTHCGNRQVPVYLARPDYAGSQLDCSEQTAREIDLEVKSLLDRCYGEATEILNWHRAQLDRVSAKLLECETLDADEFHGLLEDE